MWIAKVQVVETNENDEQGLNTVACIVSDNSFEQVYQVALTECKNQECALAAIYKDLSEEEVLKDDATKMTSLAKYLIGKGSLGNILVLRRYKPCNLCTIRGKEQE